MSSSNGVIDQEGFEGTLAGDKPDSAIYDPRKLILSFCKKKDAGAFTGFYHQQADRLWRFLVARGCDHDTAYDILSESFIKFTQNICKDPRSPVAFLYRIAINLHIDHYRHHSRNPVKPDNDMVDRALEQVNEHTDDHQYLRSLIKTLPENEQNMLLMRFWIGLTHKEVAQVLDIPEGTVRRQCAEILKKLADKWE